MYLRNFCSGSPAQLGQANVPWINLYRAEAQAHLTQPTNLSTLVPNLSALAGKVPSSIPFEWRELAWAQTKKLESTDVKKKPRHDKTGHN